MGVGSGVWVTRFLIRRTFKRSKSRYRQPFQRSGNFLWSRWTFKIEWEHSQKIKVRFLGLGEAFIFVGAFYFSDDLFLIFYFSRPLFKIKIRIFRFRRALFPLFSIDHSQKTSAIKKKDHDHSQKLRKISRSHSLSKNTPLFTPTLYHDQAQAPCRI